MIYCCEEHVEWALDVIVDEFETFPKLEKAEEGKELPTTCEYCKKQAEYIVGN
jgi:CxxH/CxxC protein (TIGR04129 family)